MAQPVALDRPDPAQQSDRFGIVGAWGVRMARHRRLVMGVWLLLVVVCAAAYPALHERLGAPDYSVPGSESSAVERLAAEHFSQLGAEQDLIVFHSGRYTVDAPEFQIAIDDALTAARATTGVAGAIGPFDGTARLQISEDRHTAFGIVGLDGTMSERVDVAARVQSALTSAESGEVRAMLTGYAPIEGELMRTETADMTRAESLGLPVAALVLVLALGAVVAATIPITVTAAGIALAVGVLFGLTSLLTFDSLVLSVATMIGTGTAIDYAMFIVSRFNEELSRRGVRDRRAHKNIHAAVGAAMDTTGRTILASGLIVMISLCSLAVVGLPMLNGVAIGVVTAVVATLTAAFTLLPAVLAELGPAINRGALPAKLRPAEIRRPDESRRPEKSRRPDESRRPEKSRRPDESRRLEKSWRPEKSQRPVESTPRHSGALLAGIHPAERDPGQEHAGMTSRTSARTLSAPTGSSAWTRWARTVMGRPVLFGAVGVAVLALAAAPLLGIRYGIDMGLGSMNDRPAGQATRLVQENFGPGLLSPIQVVAAGADDSALSGNGIVDMNRFVAELGRDPRIASVLLQQADGRMLALVVPKDSFDSTAVAELTADIRSGARGFESSEISVGGVPAAFADVSALITSRFPWVIALVLSVSLAFLIFAFRSIVLAVKAILLNLLATGAALGITVAVFQYGIGESVLGFHSAGFLQVYLPMLVFAVLFGLSMDYEVFLVRRMKEAWDRHPDNAAAVAEGLQRTARPITAAAAIMVAVFAAFVTADVLELKQIGFALAVAVAIDAVIVRLILVPAFMQLFGRWNWWLPSLPRKARDERSLTPQDAKIASSAETSESSASM
ncbi:MMPL family transporter [Nocardia sp. NPDC127526]|uniref:MMPL family transporter n=1 Tax=Nocardia sp. NPDC127526 TaxID=3345393 RepID=UPI00364319A0